MTAPTITPVPKPAVGKRRPAAKKQPPTGERLQKILARCGVASRRAAEALIVAGRVEVNGVTITELGVRINPLADIVSLDGERLKLPDKQVMLVLNKPVGYLSAAADPEGRPLVYWLVPKDLALRSIGRLDFNTEGVLLFTNDGDLAERLGHARFAVQRVYEARVRGVPNEETLARLRMGVRLEDGPARVEEVAVVKQTDANCWLRLVLLEGRNREVRRLLERVGHPVVRLRRISYGGVSAKGVALGQWRMLEPREIEQLQTKGHVGGLSLPPDPRKGQAAPAQLSTGPGPKTHQVRRGAGRTQGQTGSVDDNVDSATVGEPRHSNSRRNTGADSPPHASSGPRSGSRSNSRPGPSSNSRPGPSSNSRPGPSSNSRPGPSSNSRSSPNSNSRPSPNSNSRPGRNSGPSQRTTEHSQPDARSTPRNRPNSANGAPVRQRTPPAGPSGRPDGPPRGRPKDRR
ncbi:MAG: pseudouridine synthase [Myxococcales bacterium]|nr:pseudouridine synthase [Myxococcales bacterium]